MVKSACRMPRQDTASLPCCDAASCCRGLSRDCEVLFVETESRKTGLLQVQALKHDVVASIKEGTRRVQVGLVVGRGSDSEHIIAPGVAMSLRT